MLSILENHPCAVYYLSRKEWDFIPEPDNTPHPLPYHFSLSAVETPVFSWAVAGNISSLSSFLHTRILSKNHCVLYSWWPLLNICRQLPGKIRLLWQCFWHLPPHFQPEAWLSERYFHEPCSSDMVLECMYSAEGGCLWRRWRKYAKNIRNVPYTMESNWQVELAAMDLHIINLVGVFTPAFYCSATQHRLV